MKYLENNYFIFDKSNIKCKINLGIINLSISELKKVLGKPIIKNNNKIWKLRNDKIILLIKNDTIYTNIDNKKSNEIILSFISDIRKSLRSSRNDHKSIPVYDGSQYQLKGKISLYTIPPRKPPNNLIIYDIIGKKPKRNKYGELLFEDYPEFKPNKTPQQVLNLGSFGGTYFRPILSGITEKYYKNVWKEFPNKWFEKLDIKTQVASLQVRKEVNKYKVKKWIVI